MIFVVGAGRSGTTTLADLLSAVGIPCRHEPEPALIRESSAYQYGELPAAELQALLRATRGAGPAAPARPCESSQTLALILPVLAATFPQARYVWLQRNGLDVVASAMQKQWYSGHSETHARYADATPTQQAWIDGRLRADRLPPDHAYALPAAAWEELARFAKCCWYWAAVNQIIESDLQALNLPTFALRLERVRSQLPELLAWLGVADRSPAETAVPQRNLARQAPYHWTRWTDAERAAFVRWCGPQMDRTYPGWRAPDGAWRGVDYETPPRRRRAAMIANRLKYFLRNLR